MITGGPPGPKWISSWPPTASTACASSTTTACRPRALPSAAAAAGCSTARKSRTKGHGPGTGPAAGQPGSRRGRGEAGVSPLSAGLSRRPADGVVELLREFGVKQCFYGHLHGGAIRFAAGLAGRNLLQAGVRRRFGILSLENFLKCGILLEIAKQM